MSLLSKYYLEQTTQNNVELGWDKKQVNYKVLELTATRNACKDDKNIMHTPT